jgi:hypothetical protein
MSGEPRHIFIGDSCFLANELREAKKMRTALTFGAKRLPALRRH